MSDPTAQIRKLQKLKAEAQARRTSPTEAAFDVPRSFIAFLAWMLITPSPGQAEFSRVAFDGAQPVDRDLAVRIFGDIDFASLPVGVRRVVAAVVGGRGGKTYLLIALRLLYGMCVRDLSILPPGEEAFATVVAQNSKLRQQAINYALGAARSKPELRALLRLPKGTKPESAVSEFGLYRPDFDRVVTFQGAVATAGGLGVRGVWHTDLALDECAFFRDASFKVNDKDIYEAGIARVLPGGQCILGSTPWAKAGLLYEFWRDNYGKPTTALVAHAPTLLLNDRPETREVVELERKRDPDNARREYDAVFMESGTTVFFEASSVDGSITEEPFIPEPGDFIASGADLGFKADSSAIIFVALRGDTAHIFDGAELRPTDDAPLSPKHTFTTFASMMLGRCGFVMADGHYQVAMLEELQQHKLSVVPAPATPAETYVRARQVFRAGKVKIHPLVMADETEIRTRLIKQLREVHGKPTSGGGMSIQHPRWATGGHGDIADALALALYQVTGDEVAEGVTTLEDRAAQLKRERYEHFKNEEERPHWVSKGGATDRGRGAHWRRR